MIALLIGMHTVVFTFTVTGPAFSITQALVYPLHSTNFNNGGIEPAETAVRPQKNIIFDRFEMHSRSKTVINRETSLEGAFRFIADLAMSIQISLLTVKNIN